MPEINVQELMVVGDAWLASLRRTWVSVYPDRDCPVTTFEQMRPEVKAMFLRALRDGFRAVTPENVQRRAIERGQ